MQYARWVPTPAPSGAPYLISAEVSHEIAVARITDVRRLVEIGWNTWPNGLNPQGWQRTQLVPLLSRMAGMAYAGYECTDNDEVLLMQPTAVMANIEVHGLPL